MYSVEPEVASWTRNLLATDALRSALRDETEPDRPEVAGIGEAKSLASSGPRLARGRPSPHLLVTPHGKVECVVPECNPAEEMHAIEADKIARLDVDDAALVNNDIGDASGSHEITNPCAAVRVNLIIIRFQHDRPYDSAPRLAAYCLPVRPNVEATALSAVSACGAPRAPAPSGSGSHCDETGSM